MRRDIHYAFCAGGGGAAFFRGCISELYIVVFVGGEGFLSAVLPYVGTCRKLYTGILDYCKFN